MRATRNETAAQVPQEFSHAASSDRRPFRNDGQRRAKLALAARPIARHGRGWLQLHAPVAAVLPPGGRIRAALEAYGRLRIMLHGVPAPTPAVVQALEWVLEESVTICESCGCGDGIYRRQLGKWKTLCDRCDDAELAAWGRT